ncbi:hypothetical protein SDC9_128606 [bioreactor metagenome]|uniref:Uncharacterized protein n=1 Tax=bioreactor metagenome TaxID=1076179 RepID=A0A645CXY1_9ZZZZ
MDCHRSVHRCLAQLELCRGTPARLYREGGQCADIARLLHQPLRGWQQPVAHRHGAGDSGVLHRLLRLRRGRRRPPVRVHVRHGLPDSPVGRRRGHHGLCFHRRLSGRELDRHHPGLADDHRADHGAADGDLCRRRRGCQQCHHRNCAQRCLRYVPGPGSDRHRLLAGLGSGLLRPAPHSGALHGGRVDQDHSQRTPHRHELDGAVPGRRRGRGLLRHCLLCQPPRYRGERQRQP